MQKELKQEIDRNERIRDRYSAMKMSVCIIWKHNRRGEIDHYIIQKKKEWRRNKRHTVKVFDHYGDCVDLKFETKDEALKRLDTQPVETMLVSDELDFIVY